MRALWDGACRKGHLAGPVLQEEGAEICRFTTLEEMPLFLLFRISYFLVVSF